MESFVQKATKQNRQEFKYIQKNRGLPYKQNNCFWRSFSNNDHKQKTIGKFHSQDSFLQRSLTHFCVLHKYCIYHSLIIKIEVSAELYYVYNVRRPFNNVVNKRRGLIDIHGRNMYGLMETAAHDRKYRWYLYSWCGFTVSKMCSNSTKNKASASNEVVSYMFAIL